MTASRTGVQGSVVTVHQVDAGAIRGTRRAGTGPVLGRYDVHRRTRVRAALCVSQVPMEGSRHGPARRHPRPAF
jgi:hypothetical protein